MLDVLYLLRDAIAINSNPSFARILIEAEEQFSRLELQLDIAPTYQKKLKFWGELELKPLVLNNKYISKAMLGDIKLLHTILIELVQIEADRLGVNVKELMTTTLNKGTLNRIHEKTLMSSK